MQHSAPVLLTSAATEEVNRYFGDPAWEGFRNLTAGARGVFLAPGSTNVGFIVGAQFGSGVILARHGEQWSDPVFVRLINYNVGILAGAAKSSVLMLILTDAAINQFVDGVRKASTSGGFAIGNWGAGGLGAGGFSGGAQVLTAQTSSGLFAGGGLGSAQMILDNDLNTAAYGPDFNALATLAGNGGQFVASTPLRLALARAAQAGAR